METNQNKENRGGAKKNKIHITFTKAQKLHNRKYASVSFV
jgi:hypothetical protein